jgi:FMN phosphatase YigB (HAD superfamily)/glycosyltransferase involved in cell wall biosynthesis
MSNSHQKINVAFIHHHLNRGGVTHVIRDQLSALKTLASQGYQIRAAILFGGRGAIKQCDFPEDRDSLRCELIDIPDLEYDSLRNGFSGDPALGGQLRSNLERISFEPQNTILHVHNHALGKNGALPLALKSLAQDGFRILLQVHDFAEDFRYENYNALKQRLADLDASIGDVYPDAKQVHYSVINQRDKQVLDRLGLDQSIVHYLPNAIAGSRELPDHQQAKREFLEHHGIDPESRLLVYPVRGIRRKNVGEAILLTAIAPEKTCVGVPLSPLNPIEKASFDSWQRFSIDHHLPALFGIGGDDGLPFETNLAAADRILTTSVAEGFGMVFLESFLLGKDLIGRDIPYVTEDFKGQGISFESLYSELQVPLNLINLNDLQQQLHSSLARTWAEYDREFEEETLANHLQAIHERQWIDFAELSSRQQRDVISSAVRDPRSRQAIQERNPELMRWLSRDVNESETQIQHNQKVVRRCFSIQSSADQLVNIYRELLSQPVSDAEHSETPEAVLDSFLDVNNFHAIRAESLDEIESNASVVSANDIRGSLVEIKPIATGVEPRLGRLPGIKAVLFDIYGTLLVSSSGDVGTDPQFEDQQSRNDDRLERMLLDLGLSLSAAAELLTSTIFDEHQQLRKAGIPYPEIDILALWYSILATHASKDVSSDRVAEIAMRFELLKNPVWLMPGFRQCLAALQQAALPVGIISNAQFYTAPIVEALAYTSLEQLGFQPKLSHFSFRFGRAKPDQFLYKLAAESLKRFHIEPSEVLYVGNDVTKDMIPAKATGFATALFAGDQRSLRCGEHGDPHHHHSVDRIITDLSQINSLLQHS